MMSSSIRLVLLVAPCIVDVVGAFVRSPLPAPALTQQPQHPPLTRRYFRAPEPIPVVTSLEKNATWSFDMEPSDDKDDFSMPWLAIEAPWNRTEGGGIMSKKGAGIPSGPALFTSRLGAWDMSERPAWLRPVDPSALEEPAADQRMLTYKKPTGLQSFGCSVRRRVSPFPLLARAVPLNSVIVGSIAGDDLNLLVESGQSLAKLFQEPPVGWIEPVSPFVKAAHDPRVSAMLIRIGRITCGYAKLTELRRHMEYFKASGKTLVAYLDSGAEKEYYAALGCDEIYMPPGGSLRLQGFVSSASFLRGVLDKVGLEPTVVRIGKYKSAGDTINRSNSTEAFREVQTLLLQQTADHWVTQVSSDLNKTAEEVVALWDTPMTEPVKLAHQRFITASLYYDQVKDVVTQRFSARRWPWSKKKPAKLFGIRPFLRAVGTGKKILPALPGVRGPRVAVLNAAGSISANGPISATELNDMLKEAEEDPGVKAVVLRIDSPGGDALTSELIWRRILKLRSIKPVVASMVDVAASGGYFLAMGCNAIVAEETTITGSIGVVAILFKLKALFDRIGLNEESISIGKYAKLLIPSHTLTDDEREMFEKDVWASYQDFVGKAAFCRNFTWEAAHEVAQGRVWRGTDAMARGLVDTHGGVWRAVEVAKKLAKIDDKRSVNLMVVKGSKRLFSRGSSDGDDVAWSPLSASSASPQEPGTPMAVADEQVELYFKAVGAALPGVPLLDGRLGLGGSLALLQRLGKPLAEKLLLMMGW